jgi:diguanylate cyclase (GGDEF)-like protein
MKSEDQSENLPKPSSPPPTSSSEADLGSPSKNKPVLSSSTDSTSTKTKPPALLRSGTIPESKGSSPAEEMACNPTALFVSQEKHTSNGTPSLHAPIPLSEEQRIARLLGFEILDTGNDPKLDRLTRLASIICDVPAAMISLIDRNRQWFKSVYGLPIRETPRDISFCAHAIIDPDRIFVVPDTTKDPRFATNPLVTESPYIRFYAGAPLVTEDRIPIGTFCVVDYKPKQLNEHQLEALQKLSEIAMDMIDVHRSNTKLTRLLHLEKEVYSRLLRSSADLVTTAPTFDEALNFLMSHLDENLGWLTARIRNMQTGGTTGISYNKSLPFDPELPMIWQKIDSDPKGAAEIHSHTRFVSTAPLRPEYSYLAVPIRLRDRLVALIELIYPDHRKVEKRIQEIFDLMASNLAIVAERELVLIDLQHQATHDNLTGAANRPVIMKGLEKAIRESEATSPDSILLFFDIDGFKEVNDNFGHDTGDRLLIDITKRLNGICRSNDLLGRLSGDEFVLLARGIDVEEGLGPLLERIQKTLSTSFMIGELEIRVNASIGCAVIADPDLTANELLRRAEEAMYLVKTGERKGFCIADEEVIRSFGIKRALDRKVKDAFQNNRFFAVFQPIVDLRTEAIAGFEALMRILDRNGKVMEASEFMQTIQRTRYLPQLDDYVLAETLRTFRTDSTKHFMETEGFRFSVNIGSAILSSKGYAMNCLNQLSKSNLSPQNLMLEIIESSLLQPSPTVISNLTTLREQGVAIALDDFGTGYSNLQQLSTLPVDIIKIDKEFIHGIAKGDITRNSLLGAIMDIGKNLGYEIIAEGVEEKTEADYLKSIGCHYAQGYYFGKPSPIAEWIMDRKVPTDNDAVTVSVGTASGDITTRQPGDLLHQQQH